MVDYRTAGFKFGDSGDAGTPGGTLTWAIDPSTPSSFLPILATAFDDWSNAANIQFKQVDWSASPTIKIVSAHVDGPGNTIAKNSVKYGFFSGSKFKLATSSTITFDSDENWHSSGSDVVSNSGSSLLSTALAEIGYTIGLDDNFSKNSLFALLAPNNLMKPSDVDIAGAKSIYGSPPAAWYLVDHDYYIKTNPDIVAAPVSPMAHYYAFGWHENRDPNAYFSTIGYLAANPDVNQAKANPLDHYDQHGWKEGRDPSARFDNELYLLHNPDVKAAGVDPLLHYLQAGKAEGRQAYDAIGQASSFSHGSFDAEYYLLANPDVAKAALNAGSDTFSFAYRHFANSGWKEGRKADAFFDSAYYLASNPDVAAAHIDPLAHYDTFGWKEGRNPSKAFDTNAYLAANPDVAAAHVDPLLHYLQHGALEGRNLA